MAELCLIELFKVLSFEVYTLGQRYKHFMPKL